MESEKESLSVIERIRRASDKHPGVGYRELAGELSRLATDSNDQAVRELFEAYVQWKSQETSPEDARIQALDKLDLTARFADNLKTERDVLEAMFATVENPAIIGDVTRFYRSAVNYTSGTNPVHLKVRQQKE